MIPAPWSPPWRLACVLAGCALGCPAPAQPLKPAVPPPTAASAPAALPTLAQVLDAAWARSLEGVEARGRQAQARAEEDRAAAWLAGAPTLELSRREGRGAAAAGSRETEVGLALPLWRPGQRRQQVRRAQTEAGWALAAERAARLRLAAQLRDLAARVQLAEADARQSTQQRQLLEALAQDVERRVRAGDLAPADALAARAELLAARSLEDESRQALAAQRSDWLLLSGSPQLPQPETAAPPAQADLERHAEAQLAEAEIERARQRVAQLQARRLVAPELGLGLRQEQPGRGQSSQHSLALALKLPLGAEPQQQAELAAALAEQDLALRAQQRLRAQLAAELDLARGQLATRQAQAEAEEARAALLRERARLLQRAFQAGEAALPELLRALGAAAQAEAAAARQHAARAQAQGRLQHAFGQLP